MQLKINKFSDLQKLNRREILTRDGNLKRNLDNKFLISAARKIAAGFENVDLRKEPTKNEIKRARKTLKIYLESTRYNQTKIIKPSKKNRAKYAEYADVPKTFRYIPMPVYDSDDKFTIRNGRVKRIGLYTQSEFFKFASKRNLITNTQGESKKTFNKIKKQFGKNKFELRIKCGRAEYPVRYDDYENPAERIQQFISSYGKENVLKWCVGYQAYTFKNQDFDQPIQKIKMKKGKRKNKYGK